MAEKFWGKTFGLLTKAAVLPFAVGKGIYNAAKGDRFKDGYNETYEEGKSDIEAAEEFGDKNNNGIRDCLGSAASIFGILLGAKSLKKK